MPKPQNLPDRFYDDPVVMDLATNMMQLWETCNASYNQMRRAFEILLDCSRDWPLFPPQPKEPERQYTGDTEVVMVDKDLPAMCRLVNWETGEDRMVKLIPKAMWGDYVNKRRGRILLPVDQEYTDPDSQKNE